MKQQRRKTEKEGRESIRERRLRHPLRITVPWGRAASEHRPGLFIKRYFVEHRQAYAADVYRALSDELRRLNGIRIEMGEAPFRRPNYSSFSRYMHWFGMLGLIERTDKREPAIHAFLQQRVFYRLIERGEAEVRGWEDPVRTAHPEFG